MIPNDIGDPKILEEIIGKEGIEIILIRMNEHIKKYPDSPKIIAAYKLLNEYYQAKYNSQLREYKQNG